ncbi:MAG: hypothetical protein JJU12_07100 [Chlamydiales bacterium]|nr:hypothetical protein [Chlamydiales bacterium]
MLYLPLQAVQFPILQNIPFEEVDLIRGRSDDEELMIACHGYGGNKEIAEILADFLPCHLIGFNFPDHGSQTYIKDPLSLHFGSMEELTPLIKILRQCVIEGNVDKIHLYGFSAGGGAVVNALAVLNNGRYDSISPSERKAILKAVEKGSVILDCPLKSIDEVIAARGSFFPLRVVQEQYKRNNLVPIDSVKELTALSLTIFVHFQVPDAILSNRDDTIFIERLKEAVNTGKIFLIEGNEGRHLPCLPSLRQKVGSFFSQN